MGFSTSDARFVGTVLEAWVYGIYSIVFGLYLHVKWKASKETIFNASRIIHYALCFLFIVATIYFSFDVVLEFLTLLRPLPPQNAGNIGVDFGTLRVRLNVLLSVTFAIMDWLSQMVLIYRCWIVWNRKLVVVFLPILLSVTSFFASLILSGKLVSLDNSGNPPPNWFLPLGTAGFSLSLVVNVLVTTTLVGRLLTFMRQTREVFPTTHHSYLNPILAVLIESGMLMLAAQMAYVIVFKLNTSPFWLLEGPIVMIYGLTPTLLAVRTALGKTYETRVSCFTSGTHMEFGIPTTRTGQETNNDMAIPIGLLGPQTSYENGSETKLGV